jgi:protein tyrosine/serine phosphatase
MHDALPGPDAPELAARFVPLVGAHNFRDLGGYPTADGRRTRWGRLYRSDALHNLTVDDVTTLRRLGLRTIVDLRTPSETARLSRGPLADEDIRYVSASVSVDTMDRVGPSPAPISIPVPGQIQVQVPWDPPLDPSTDPVVRYLSYLEDRGEAFVQVVEEMLDVDHLPLVFHCFFGKDRSGVMAALVLSSLGVERRLIADDFALSEVPVRRILDAMRDDPVYRETIEQTPSELLLARTEKMDAFLSELEERHGGARSWFLAAGLSAEQLDHMAGHLLE